MAGLENDVILHSLYADFVIIITVIKFFFFGQGVQWLNVGSQFPDKGSNPGRSDESAKSNR